MEVKRVGDRLQATLDPAEALRLGARNGPKVADAIRSSVWRILQVHALQLLDGMKIGWSAIDVINDKVVVTFGPASFHPDAIRIPEQRSLQL